MNIEDTLSSHKMENPLEMNDKKKKEKEEKDGEKKKSEFFTVDDIGSNYFQVLRAKGRPSLCKIIWWIISAILFVFCVFMVYKLLKGYFEYKSFDKVQVKWVNNVTLPAITICSPNALNYTMIKENLNSTQLDALEKLINDVAEMSADVNFTLTDEKRLQMQQEYAWLDNMDYGQDGLFQYYKMDPYYFTTFPDFDYKFAGKEIFMSQAEYNKLEVPHELGTCLRLNENQKMVQTVAGSKWGLTVDLHANLAHYVFNTPSAGFKIFLRNANETLLLQDSGYLVQPGMETFIKLKKKKVKRLKAPYGECNNTASTFEPSHMRTSRECNEHEKMVDMVDWCGCIPWYLAKRIENVLEVYYDDSDDPYKIQVPTVAQNKTYERLKAFWTRESLENPDEYNASDDDIDTCSFFVQQICNILVNEKLRTTTVDEGAVKCKESCKYEDYDVEITSSIFPPTENYYDYMIAPRAKDYGYSFEEARETFVRVHIFYGELTESNVEQEKAYEVQNFIAEFGGTVDLLIGISFFTLFQVGEIAVAYFIFKCWKKNKEEGEEDECYENKV